METKKKEEPIEEPSSEPTPIKDEVDKQRRRKAYWIGFAIAFAVSIGLAVGAFFLIKDGLRLDYEKDKWRIWTDTFTIPGVAYLLVFALVKVSDFGAFDAIVFSVRTLVNTVFFPATKNSRLPRNYREYREMKSAKPRSSASFLLFIGLGYMAVMVVFLILWFVNRPAA